MTESANTITSPDFTDTVNQEFFIEPLGGSKNPYNLLENFPETIFTHSPDSNLASLLYALLGPAGVGALRQNYLQARLDFEEDGLNTVDLDDLYANIFNFARFASETYEYIPTGLLTNEQWEKIQIADASYRNRAIKYLKAARAGGTLLGITLAAESGLDRPVNVIENYRYLYDQYSDDPLGLEQFGVTESTEEIVIVPRQDVPQSVMQTITFSDVATTGSWTLLFPLGSQTATFNSETSFNEVQSSLEALPTIGKGNVIVTGGPTTRYPIVISFTRELADKALPEFIVSSSLFDIDENFITVSVELNQVGVEADGEESAIAPSDWYYANVAIEKIKPITTILTPGKGAGSTKRQIPNLIFSDSTFTQVVRYVTGLNSVKWPTVDSTHWIVGGKEEEAPLSQYAQRQHYLNFHNISTTSAYTDTGLIDPAYGTSSWPEVLPLYDSEQIGPFSSEEQVLYPVLQEYVNPTLRYESSFGIALPPNLLTVQSLSGETSTNLIEGIYPTDYQSLSGIQSIPTQNYFWSSLERIEGTDYFEIDLGRVQAVNYISFQATNKPFEFEVSYDILDMSPQKSFTPAALEESSLLESTTILGYDASSGNPWKHCELYLQNSLDGMIFTRFLRIGFKRRTGAPFQLANGTLIPFSIQVKNLRVGRSLS